MVHVPYIMPYMAKDPLAPEWYQYPLVPLALFVFALVYSLSKVAHFGTFMLRGYNISMWCTPRLGFNYFLECDQPRINQIIEECILESEKKGVKVFALGALNKVRRHSLLQHAEDTWEADRNAVQFRLASTQPPTVSRLSFCPVVQCNRMSP